MATPEDNQTVLIPVKVDAFVFNSKVCDGIPPESAGTREDSEQTETRLPTPIAAKIAPITQPNYTFLRLDRDYIQPDIQNPVDLNNSWPSGFNSRFTDLGSDTTRKRRVGVYLHWTMPRLYRSGIAAAGLEVARGADFRDARAARGLDDLEIETDDGNKNDDQKNNRGAPGTAKGSSPSFPKAPTRWLVIRHISDSSSIMPPEARGSVKEFTAWVVESDRLRTLEELGPEEDLQVDVSPFISAADGGVSVADQAEVFIGKKEPIESWSEPLDAPPPPPPPSKKKKPQFIENFSLLASSNQLFADYQPHNSNVFSIVDNFEYTKDNFLVAAKASYYVIGWHSVPGDDLFAGSTLGKGLERRRRLELLKLRINKLLTVNPASPVTFSNSRDLTGYWNGLPAGSTHNIVINEEKQYAVAVGAQPRTSTCRSGLIFIDLKDPAKPTTLGCAAGDGYVHDAQCLVYRGPDTKYQGRDICYGYNEDTLTIYDVTDKTTTKIISRTSYEGASYTHQGWVTNTQAGTRFNSRGIDDDGNVANFVETETTYWSPRGTLFSFSQVRGSVPLFWEQAADLLPGKQNISITRSPEGTQPAFNKHFQDLEHAYGAVHVVNLLSEEKPGEAQLSKLYHNAVRHSPLSQVGQNQSQDHALLRETHYDFHAETRGAAGYESARNIRRHIENSTEGFAYYLAEETDDVADDNRSLTTINGAPRMVVLLQQEGVFRTNCLDCLDRTNLIQTLISSMAMESFLGQRGEYATSDFWMRHSTLWADNGDALSKIYAGTGALKSSYTRTGKMSLAGAVADMRKSMQRLYHNNFTDAAKQTTIDRLLGRLVGQTPMHIYDPISDFVAAEMSKRSAEFSSTQDINMWVGTFNLNGRTQGIDHDLSSWLCPKELGPIQPEIVAVGFQEIVDLSPQQIMNSDPTRKRLWEKAVKRTLNSHFEKAGGERYVLLRSGQLVGAALCIFVKASSLSSIKNVEGSVKKTGMSGMAGNKGAVAIRFDYASTPICFVTAHLAAGFSNYDERNRDYATIHDGLRFQRNRGIDDHDTVIWLGDFNYRIGLGPEAARSLVKKKDLATLYENDQLNLQMVAGLSFPFYSEARITFLPTYKFDLGTDDYDTSEKARIPAWTDRILRKGQNLRQLCYNSAPLRFSDHRPVYATFQCTVNIVDESHREQISQELYLRRKQEVGDPSTSLDTEDEDEDDEDLIGYDAVEPGLPPASSDRQKWWLDNKQPARAGAGEPVRRDDGTRLGNGITIARFVLLDEPVNIALRACEHSGRPLDINGARGAQGTSAAI
ncbi:Inositol-1 like protein [Verticillium longisporum]|nr:Inositol-1 like protein [Verticillium longisporum]